MQASTIIKQLVEDLPMRVLDQMPGISFDDRESIQQFKQAIMKLLLYGINLMLQIDLGEFQLKVESQVTPESVTAQIVALFSLTKYKLKAVQERIRRILAETPLTEDIDDLPPKEQQIQTYLTAEQIETIQQETINMQNKIAQLESTNQLLGSKLKLLDYQEEAEESQPEPPQTLELKLESIQHIQNLSDFPSKLIQKHDRHRKVREKRVISSNVSRLAVKPADFDYRWQKTQDSFLKKKNPTLSIHERLYLDSVDKRHRLDVLKNHIETLDQFRWEQILSILQHCQSNNRKLYQQMIPSEKSKPHSEQQESADYKPQTKKSNIPAKYYQKPKMALEQDPEQIFNQLQDEFSSSRTNYIESMLSKYKQKTCRIAGSVEKTMSGHACFKSRTGMRNQTFDEPQREASSANGSFNFESTFQKFYRTMLKHRSPSSEDQRKIFTNQSNRNKIN